MINFVNENGDVFFECNEAEARVAKKCVVDSRMDASSIDKKKEIEVASLYLHICNGGVTFSAIDGDLGVAIKIKYGHFGHSSELCFRPEIRAIDSITEFFSKVSAYPFQKQYTSAARNGKIECDEKLFTDEHSFKSLHLDKFGNMIRSHYESDYDLWLDKIIPIDTWSWLQKEASKELKEESRSNPSHSDHVNHWQSIVDGDIPFGFKLGSPAFVMDDEIKLDEKKIKEREEAEEVGVMSFGSSEEQEEPIEEVKDVDIGYAVD